MRKILQTTLVLLLALMIACSFVGCGDSNTDGNKDENLGGTNNDSSENATPDTDTDQDSDTDGTTPESTQKFNIYFYSLDGTYSVLSAESGSEVDAIDSPSFAGYLFDGWHTQENGMGSAVEFPHVATADAYFYPYFVLALDYKLVEDEYHIAGIGNALDDDNTYIEIPAMYQGKPVTAIEENAFAENCSDITNIYVGSNIDYIGKNAFSGCEKLRAITLPFVGIEQGDNNTFSVVFNGVGAHCLPETLKTVVILGGEIEDAGFSNCVSITNIILENPTSIGDMAFMSCNLSLWIGGEVQSIGSMSFLGGIIAVSFELSKEDLSYLGDSWDAGLQVEYSVSRPLV